MRNRDEPAAPSDRQLYFGKVDGKDVWDAPLGLTKREAATIAVMQGLLSGEDTAGAASVVENAKRFNMTPTRFFVRLAVQHADALFDELETEERTDD